ncbi:MAG: PKD domain-containing protein, partial [Gemmatimonadota bacterium]|nr:PKD domain-containing protein [Gemmatimonadota bacterium]
GAVSSSQSPSHAYAAAGDYTVTLTVTDDDGLTDTAQQTISATQPPSQAPVLTAVGLKVRGRHVIDLAWTGTSGQVDVIRDGVLITTLPANTLTYRDATGGQGKATYTYVVCEVGAAVCSDEVVVAF